MEDIAMIALLIGGLVGIIQHNGGIDWLLQFVRARVKSKRGAELGIASLVSAADISTANNTISIIMAGPLAKNIADEYDVDPRKSASILDIFEDVSKGYSHIVLKLFQQLVLLVFLHSYLFLIVSIQFY